MASVVMASVLAGMPDLWRRALTEHVPDERNRCVACHDNDGTHAEWPCLSYIVADEARSIHEGPSASGRHAR